MKKYEYTTEREDLSTTILTVMVVDDEEGKTTEKIFKVLDTKNEFTIVLEGLIQQKPERAHEKTVRR